MAAKTELQQAVQATAEVKDAWRPGKQALRDADRRRVNAADDARLTGSIHLDKALRQSRPNDPRWDYGIGHRPSNRTGEMIYWIEVHPATESEVAAMVKKVEWLRNWLRNSAPRLNALHREFVWISSNKTSLSRSSPQARKLATKGIQLAGRYFEIQDAARA